MKYLSVCVLLLCLVFPLSTVAEDYPCHFKQPVHVTAPYDIAFCYTTGDQIMWAIGFTPQYGGMLYVAPMTGDPWYFSNRSGEKLTGCDASHHCFKVKAYGFASPAGDRWSFGDQPGS